MYVCMYVCYFGHTHIEKMVLYNVDYVSTKPLVLNKVCMYVCMLFWSHTHRKDGSVQRGLFVDQEIRYVCM